MQDIKKVRNRLLELTRAVNQAKGEEKAKLVEQKEKILEQYTEMKRKNWKEEQER